MKVDWKGTTIRYRLVKLAISGSLLVLLAMQLGAGRKF
jgi:hypothetical protein